MSRLKTILILLNLGLIIGFVSYSVQQKEKILSDGQLILLELRTFDPRSLIQGDYMRLDYNITFNSVHDSLPKTGYCIVSLDENKVAQNFRFQRNLSPLKIGEFPIKYRVNSDQMISIGAESYFFREGHGEKYENAQYSGLKVDKNGNSVLIGLYDESRRRIK